MSVRNRFQALFLVALCAISAAVLPAAALAQKVPISYIDSNFNYQFGTVNLSTGIVTNISSENDIYIGLTTTPNGTVYAEGSDSSGTINPLTGGFTDISPLTTIYNYENGNLAANSNTTLFTLLPTGGSGTQLYAVDPTFSIVTPIGNPDPDGETYFQFGNLTFGPGGQLYYVASVADFFGEDNGLYTVNPATGVKTFVFDDPGIDDSGIEPNVIWGLVSANGVLYGFVSPIFGDLPTSRIVEIDPVAQTVTPGAYVTDSLGNPVLVASATNPLSPIVLNVRVVYNGSLRAGIVSVVIWATNTGSQYEQTVTITAGSLMGVNTYSALPKNLGTIKPGQTVVAVLGFQGLSSSSGQMAQLLVQGTSVTHAPGQPTASFFLNQELTIP